MSFGLTPQEFVKQVYYVQEKVLLDLTPNHDKYKEVLYEANLVLQELQKEEDWLWLRERIELGPCHAIPGQQIPEFELPEWVYKPSMLHRDGVRLHLRSHHGPHIQEHAFILVPWIPAGAINGHITQAYNEWGMLNSNQIDLGAVWFGNTITFNRPLFPHEQHRIAVTDVQRRFIPLHVCDDSCVADEWVDAQGQKTTKVRYPDHPCNKIEKRVFTEIPDPNYVVYRTAALHAEGSPPAQGRLAGLADQARTLLSAMRANDSAATTPDMIEKHEFGYFNIL